MRGMIDEARARELAEAEPKHRDAILGEARELREGWFFPYRMAPPGSQGVIINKKTGKPFHLGSAFPAERDLTLYDRGYQFHNYDLVILTVRDRKASVRTLRTLNFGTVEPTYENGVVWRIRRALTEAEIRKRLKKLPCVFTGGLYFQLELLEEAREAGWFTFEALGVPPPAEWVHVTPRRLSKAATVRRGYAKSQQTLQRTSLRLRPLFRQWS